MKDAFLEGKWQYLLICGFLIQLAYIIQAFRWALFMKSSDSSSKLSQLIKIYIAGFFLDIYTPGTLGSDAYRIYKASKGRSLTKAATVHTVFRLQGMIFQSIIGIICLFMIGFFEENALFFLFPVLFVLILLLSIVIIKKTIRNSKKKAQTGIYKLIIDKTDIVILSIKHLMRDYKLFVFTCLLIVLYTLNNITIYFVCSKAYGSLIPYVLLIATVPIINLARMFPLTIQGRGVTEGLAYILWRSSDITPKEAVLVCLSIYFLGLLNSIICGSLLIDKTNISYPLDKNNSTN